MIARSGQNISFTPSWIGTLADGRIASASTWNAKVGGSGTNQTLAIWNGTNSISSYSDLVYLNSNQSLGVGTSTPTYKIDVVGNIRVSTTTGSASIYIEQAGIQNTIETSASGDGWLYLWNKNTSAAATSTLNIGLTSNSITKFNGNVGIGTSTPPTNLYVVGSSTITNGLTLSNITGSAQCLHVDTNGHITGAGSDCASTAGLAATANNLSDLQSTSTARTNLGLGTMALEPNTGSSTITTLGTITTGVWNGSTIGAGYFASSSLVAKANNGSDFTSTSSVRSNIGVGTADTPTFAGVTPSGDNNTIKYGEKVLCNLMFSYTTSTSSWYDDCFVPVTSTITRVKSKVQDGAVTWNLFYNNTATLATTTGMYKVFTSNQTSNTTTTVIATPTASSTPNDVDFIRVYATSASSTEFSIQILGKDR